MDHFLRVTFKYRENPFDYDITTTQETIQETTQEIDNTTQEKFVTLNETQMGIIRLMKNNPSITLKEIAKEFNLTRDGVKYNVNVLKEMGIIVREGSTKKGTWKITKE